MMRLVMKDLNSELVQVPPFDKIETLLDCYESENYRATENLANAIAKEFPDHSVAWKVLGVIFKREGRLLDALVANQKVVWIEPQEPNGYFNLGNNLNDLGRFEDAAESYIKAISEACVSCGCSVYLDSSGLLAAARNDALGELSDVDLLIGSGSILALETALKQIKKDYIILKLMTHI